MKGPAQIEDVNVLTMQSIRRAMSFKLRSNLYRGYRMFDVVPLEKQHSYARLQTNYGQV